ncbi:MAG TPA: 2-oxoacid:acceptor oxidoreductase subunit alpha, partial [Candidatus Cloacimonadota bacterium]|nr:2-oxoacid:acceptor oxidoreductase subunit alpha [Candidatus Cloacimonadota bacterium]
SAKAAIKAAREYGIKVGLLRPITIWPFPDDAVKKMLRDVDTIIVPELNEGQLINELHRLTKDKADGKIIPIQRSDGEMITPTHIFRVIKEAH